MQTELIVVILMLFIAALHFLNRNDEFLFLIPLFFYATGIKRYEAVTEGKANWVEVRYAWDIFEMTNEIAKEALDLFFTGTIVFFISYFIFSVNQVPLRKYRDSNKLFNMFLLSKRYLVIALFVIFLLVNSYTRLALMGSKSIAYGQSYAYMFKLAIGGIILLAYLFYRNINFQKQTALKLSLLAIGFFAAYVSYNPYMRFQFLSWMIALVVLIVKDIVPMRKFYIYGIGGIVVIIIFAMAGNVRHGYSRYSYEDQVKYAIYRLNIAEDQNMLDGLMMVMQVYPEHLDYHYGMEHFEILLRPIPRAWWPDKPVGGYANKLGLNDNMKGKTVGISQTIYGTFYGEGGFTGIIIFSFIYGYLFFRLFRYSETYNSDMRFLLKGIILASTIPLLRGGDLPGIIAFIGMSYWPVFLFLYQYNRFIKQQYFIEHMNKSIDRAAEKNTDSLGQGR